MEKVVVIGSGPAGLTAGLYAARARLSPLVVEGMERGGQLVQTLHVANWPGHPGVAKGADIVDAMRRQAEDAGVRFKMDVVKSVDFSGEAQRLFTLMGDEIEAETVIVATGAGVSKTNAPGEAKYFGRGISACLVCDAAFYSGRRVVVVGEGAPAVGAKRYLEGVGATVAAVLAPSEIAEFEGDGQRLAGVALSPSSASGSGTVAADGAFLVTARLPETKFLGGALELDPKGHVVTTDTVRTSVPGVFAAGDCARPRYKQAVVAAADGAIAALAAQEYLSR